MRAYLPAGLLLLGSVTGCASQVANHLESYDGIANIQPPFFDDLLSVQHCLPKEQSFELPVCLTYLDFANVEHEVEGERGAFNHFTWTLTLNDKEFDKVRFQFPELDDTAPVMFLFPGYGMTATAALVPAGLYFRSLGFHVIALPGPTQQVPFRFGMGSAEHASALAQSKFADRDLHAYSFSMGVLALTELETELKQQNRVLSSAVVNAPMLDFRENATTIFTGQRNQQWHSWLTRGLLISDRRFDKALDEIFARSNESEANLTLAMRINDLPPKTLILGSNSDPVAPFERVEAMAQGYDFELVEFPDTGHIMLGFAHEPIRQVIGTWFQQHDLLPNPSAPALTLANEEETTDEN